MSGELPRRMGIVGLGLMGGSLARALREVAPEVRIAAAEPRAEVRERAVREGVVDEAHEAPSDWLGGCEIVVLCTPIAAIEALLAPVSCRMPQGSVLSDVGGAKERVLVVAREDLHPGVSFVGAHPMFGGRGGFEASRADRWRGGTVAVCTDGVPAPAAERVAALHRALGAKVVSCTAAEHDLAVAMVSHLPYLLAGAMSLAARGAGPLAQELAGPGLNDATRLAAFAFDIQGEVARRNAHLPGAAAELERQLHRLLGSIAESKEAARQALEEARAAREELF